LVVFGSISGTARYSEGLLFPKSTVQILATVLRLGLVAIVDFQNSGLKSYFSSFPWT